MNKTIDQAFADLAAATPTTADSVIFETAAGNAKKGSVSSLLALASGGAATFLLYQPGGTRGYQTWAALQAAALAISGPKILAIDDSFRTVTLDVALDLGPNVIAYVGGSSGPNGGPTMNVTAVGSIALHSFPLRIDDLSISVASGGRLFAIADGNYYTLTTSDTFFSGKLADVSNGSTLYLQLVQSSLQGSAPVIATADATGHVGVVASVTSRIDNGTVSKFSGSSFNVTVTDDSTYVYGGNSLTAPVPVAGNWSPHLRFAAASIGAGTTYLGSDGTVAATLTQALAQVLLGRPCESRRIVAAHTAGAGTGNVVYSLQKNGTTVASVTVAANSATPVVLETDVPYAAGDLVGVKADGSGVTGGLPTNPRVSVE